MRNDAFQNWRREREAVEQEMDLLITSGWPASSEERQIRRTRFAALLERRETAARNLLHSGWARRTVTSPSEPPNEPWRPGDLLVPAAQSEAAGAEGEQAMFVPLPDGRMKADDRSELPEHVSTAAASPFDAVALALDVAAPPADSDTGTTGSAAVDVAELPSDVIALAPDASLRHDADAAPAAGPPADVPEPPTENAALAPDATDVTLDPAPITATGLPDDAAEPPAEEAALAPDAPAPSSEPAGLLAHPVAAATPADTAALPDDAHPLAADAGAASSPAADDLRPDALLMKLLRRLKPN